MHNCDFRACSGASTADCADYVVAPPRHLRRSARPVRSAHCRRPAVIDHPQQLPMALPRSRTSPTPTRSRAGLRCRLARTPTRLSRVIDHAEAGGRRTWGERDALQIRRNVLALQQFVARGRHFGGHRHQRCRSPQGLVYRGYHARRLWTSRPPTTSGMMKASMSALRDRVRAERSRSHQLLCRVIP